MRRRSVKAAARYAVRVPMLRRLLNTDGGGVPCRACMSAVAVDGHELHSRARGGSITDEGGTVPLCRDCHTVITQNPGWAQNRGWAVTSGSTRHVFKPDPVGYLCAVCGQPNLSWRHR